MPAKFRVSSLIPASLIVETVIEDGETVIVTAQAWFAGHPAIKIVSRDRGGGYGEAAAKALPAAVQVADRWHLMENASAAFLTAVRKSMRPIRATIPAPTEPRFSCPENASAFFSPIWLCTRPSGSAGVS